MLQNPILRIGRYCFYLVILCAIGSVVFLLQGHVLPERVVVALQVGNQPSADTFAVVKAQAAAPGEASVDNQTAGSLTAPLFAAEPALSVSATLTTPILSLPSSSATRPVSEVIRGLPTEVLTPTAATKLATLAVVGVDGAPLVITPASCLCWGIRPRWPQ